MDSLTKRLSYFMKKKNIKAVELAEAASVNTSTISRILKGSQMPTAETLYKFAQYFDVSMEYLLNGQENVKENCVHANLNSNELQLIDHYRQMARDDQEELLMIAQIKADKRKKGCLSASSPSHPDNQASEIA